MSTPQHDKHCVPLLLLLLYTDILLNFRTTYVSRKGEVVSSSRGIALNYLRGWFVVDLLAALPFDHLYASDLYKGEVSKEPWCTLQHKNVTGLETSPFVALISINRNLISRLYAARILR